MTDLKLVLKTFALLLILSGMKMNAWTQCATAPGSGNITGNVPYGDPINWANPNRVEISDDLYARVRLSPGDTSKYLLVRDFGFVIPPTATITGITVLLETAMDEDADGDAASLRLLKGGVTVGPDRESAVLFDAKADEFNLIGGDLWGTTWTAADIMDPDFGVVFSATRLSGPAVREVKVDYVGIIVTFEDPGGCILPIVLANFEANVTSEGVKLDWTTLSEQNNDHFTIERSKDGEFFEVLSVIPGAGNASQPVSYSMIDPQPHSGISYYRLSQTDFDGQTVQHNTLAVSIIPESGMEMTTYPNPATDLIRLKVVSSAEKATAELLDLNGALVRKVEFAPGSEPSLEVSGLMRGMYLLRITDSDRNREVKKVILQ